MIDSAQGTDYGVHTKRPPHMTDRSDALRVSAEPPIFEIVRPPGVPPIRPARPQPLVGYDARARQSDVDTDIRRVGPAGLEPTTPAV